MFKTHRKRAFKILRTISDDYAYGIYNVIFYLAMFLFFKSKEELKISVYLKKTV